MNKRLIPAFFILAVIFSACPANETDVYYADMPQALSFSASKLSPVQKSVSFTLVSIHPVNCFWKVYENETGGLPRADVDASYLKSENRLTLTAIGNDLAFGTYWVSITEPGIGESRRLGLVVKALYPLEITFDANGGTFSGGSAHYVLTLANASEPVVLPAPPNMADSVFTGWKDLTGNDFWEQYALIGDMRVVAQWITTGAPFTVTFEANGGQFSGAVTSVKQTGVFSGAFTAVPSPETPAYTEYQFLEWNTKADGSGMAFVTGAGGTPLSSTTLTLYAKWRWSNTTGGLVLLHDFNTARISGDTVTPAVPASPAANLLATIKGAGGSTDSKAVGGKTWYWYKTGPRLAMSNANASYLNIGEGAGQVLKNTGTEYTIAAYIRCDSDADRSGNGSFVWSFSHTNSTPSAGAVYLIANTGRNDHNITLTGSGSELRVRQNGVIQNGKWLHVAYTQSGKTQEGGAKMYINGAVAASGTVGALPSDISAELIFNTLGGPCYTADYNLSKTMFSDFRIYNRALKADQIATLAEDVAALNEEVW